MLTAMRYVTARRDGFCSEKTLRNFNNSSRGRVSTLKEDYHLLPKFYDIQSYFSSVNPIHDYYTHKI